MKTKSARLNISRRILAGSIATACATAMFGAPSAQGAVYYWDTNGVTAGLVTGTGVTTGTWGGITATTNYLTVFAAPNRGALDGTLAAVAVATQTTAADSIWFGTDNLALTGNSATIAIAAGGVTINSINFGAGSNTPTAVTLSGGGGSITLAGNSPSATPTITVNNATDTIGAVLTSATAVGMTKAGAGTLVLTGVNTYTGTTTISGGGTLQIGNGANGSLTSGALTFSSGGGVFNVMEVAGSTQSMGALTFSAGEGTVQSTYAGSGNSALAFSSLVGRSAGASANFVTSGGTNGTTNKITIAGAATGSLLDKALFFGGNSYAAYDSTGYVRAYGTDSNASTDANFVTTSTSIADSATDNVVLTGSITGQGNASINTLNMGLNTLALASGAVFTTNGILVSGGASTISGGTSLGTSSTELVVRVNLGGDALDIGTAIIGSGTTALTKSGAGTLTLSSTGNTYSGTTTINAGILAVSGGSAIANNGAVVLANAFGAGFQLNSSETIGNLSGGGISGGNVNFLASTTLTLGDAGNQTFGGKFTGDSTGAIIKQGTGTLTLSNQNSFPGTFAVNAGTLMFTAFSNAVAAGTNYTVSTGGAINLANTTTLNFSPTAAANTLGWQGQLVAPSGLAVNNVINVTGTASLRFGGQTNNSRYVFIGGVNAGASGPNTLAIYVGNAANTSGGSSDIQFSGALADANGGSLGVNVDFVGAATPAQTEFVSLSGLNTFTGAIDVKNTVGLTGGGYLVIGSDRTAVATVTAGSGSLNGGNYSGAISLASGTILDYESTATQTLGGVISGAGFLLKGGAGPLTLSNANTYTGGTAVNAGILSLATINNSGVASNLGAGLALSLGGGTLQYTGSSASTNRYFTLTAGTSTFDIANNLTISGSGTGTGALTKIGAGTLTLSGANFFSGATTVTAGNLTLSNALALQNSALVTTGAGTLTLSGITNPTIGGLNGASGDLASIISNYSTLTALTLNPNSGSVTYGGAIADSSNTVTLTKSGAGTQSLTGLNTYSGLTTINGGTLTIGTAGSLNGTTGTALTFGGTGTFNVAEGTASNQGMGALTMSAGEGTVQSTFSLTSATLTFASLAARAPGAVGNFVATSGTASTPGVVGTNRILLTDSTNAPLNTGSNNPGLFFGGNFYARYGATTEGFRAVVYGTDTNANAALSGVQATLGSIGATIDARYSGAATGSTSTATAQSANTTLTVANGALFTVGQAITGTGITANTWVTGISGNILSLSVATGTVAANAVITPYGVVSAQTTGSLNTLHLGGNGASLRLAAGQTLSVDGILNTGNTLNTAAVISGGTGIKTNTPGGEMVIRANTANETLIINTAILDNGGSKLTLSGAGAILLQGANTYTGGTFINAGTVSNVASTTLGSGDITIGGLGVFFTPVRTDSALGVAGYTFANNLIVNAGSSVSLTNGNQFTSMILNGALSGSGTVIFQTGAGGAAGFLTLANAANTFTGAIQVNSTGNGGGTLNVRSLADSANIIGFSTASTSAATFSLNAGTASPLLFNSRQIVLNGVLGLNIDNSNVSTSNTIKINTNLLVTTTSPKTLTLQGVNTGDNTFGGVIADGYNAIISVVKGGTGTWALSGNNTYSGATTHTSTGTLILSGDNRYMTGGVVVSTSSSTGPLLVLNSATALGTGTLQFGGGAASDKVRLDNTSGSLVTVSTTNVFDLRRDFTFIGTNSLTLGNGVTTTIAGLATGASRGITVTANTLTFAGGIGTSVVNTGVTKFGAGTLTLNGAETYDGATTVSAGTLNLNGTLGTGSNVLNANATTNIGVSQTLAALNIGAGAVVTLTATSPFAPLAGEALSGPTSAVVPEPGSIGLLLVGSLGLLSRRRRA